MERLSTRLRQERERLQLSVKECSEATKIREPFLHALERGEYTVLPPVYITSFVRSYASYLGISAADIATLLDEIIETDEYGEQRLVKQAPRVARDIVRSEPQKQEQSAPGSGSSPQQESSSDRKLVLPLSFKRRRLFLAITVVVVGVSTVWWLLREPSLGSVPQGDELATGNPSEVSPSDSLILTAVARDTVWLTVTSDGYSSTQSVLLPGEEARWSAMEKFTLSLGNAGGVTFYRNGQELEPLGKSGEAVRSVLINRTEIRKSSDVWKPPPPKQQPSPPASAAPKVLPQSAVPQNVAPSAAQSPPAQQRPANTTVSAPVRQTVQQPLPQRRAAPRRTIQQRRPAPARPARRQQSIPDITPAPIRPPQR